MADIKEHGKINEDSELNLFGELFESSSNSALSLDPLTSLLPPYLHALYSTPSLL